MNIQPKSPTSWTARYTLALLFLVALALTATAPAEAGKFAFGFDATYTDFDSDLDVDASFGGSVRASYFFTDRFELEGQYLDVSADPSDFWDGVELTAYFLNGVFNFRTEGNFVPYVLVGVGNAELWLSRGWFQEGLEGSSTAYHAAVGGRSYFGSTRSFALRVELSAISEDALDDSWTNRLHVTASAGLTWRFGN